MWQKGILNAFIIFNCIICFCKKNHFLKPFNIILEINIVGTKTTQPTDNNSSLKKVNSLGRNLPNKNIEKTFSGDNLYHKKKINDAIDIYNNQNNNANNNKNNGIIPSGNSSIGHKTKSSFSNMANRGGNCGSTSP